MAASENRPGLLRQAGWQVTGEDPAPTTATAPQQTVAANSATAAAAKVAPATAALAPLAAADSSAAEAANAAQAAAADDASPSQQLSSLVLMLYGIFGGGYVLYTFGWGIVAQQYGRLHQLQAAAGGSVWVFFETLLFWAAVIAPAAWFAIAAVIAKHRAPHLIALLTLGLLLLLPVPLFVTAGGV